MPEKENETHPQTSDGSRLLHEHNYLLHIYFVEHTNQLSFVEYGKEHFFLPFENLFVSLINSFKTKLLEKKSEETEKYFIDEKQFENFIDFLKQAFFERGIQFSSDIDSSGKLTIKAIKKESMANLFESYQFSLIIYLKVDNLEKEHRIQIDHTVKDFLVQEAKQGQDSEKSKEMFQDAEKACLDLTCESLETLIKEAFFIARKENRDIITIEDVKEAISSLYCKVWPFCR